MTWDSSTQSASISLLLSIISTSLARSPYFYRPAPVPSSCLLQIGTVCNRGSGWLTVVRCPLLDAPSISPTRLASRWILHSPTTPLSPHALQFHPSPSSFVSSLTSFSFLLVRSLSLFFHGCHPRWLFRFILSGFLPLRRFSRSIPPSTCLSRRCSHGRRQDRRHADRQGHSGESQD